MSSSVLRRASLLLAGGGVYGVSVYVAYTYIQMNKDDDGLAVMDPNLSPSFTFVNNPNRTQQFEKVAESYDDKINKDEFFMGINLLRRMLLYYHANGTVLEVGAGTARNLSYYPRNVKRVVLSEASENMMSRAKKKVQELPLRERRRFALLEGDSAKLQLPDNAFDTVVDTFGLCSYDDPIQALREMARVCKPDGKILLLEHGRSKTWEFVTKHLDKHAEKHAAKWGCVWNRDLDEIIESSGMKIETLYRFHFGTTYYVVCRPNKT